MITTQIDIQDKVNSDIEPIIIENEEGVSFEYSPVKEFTFKGRTFVVMHSAETDDTLILESISQDGTSELAFVDESEEQEVTDYYSKSATPAAEAPLTAPPPVTAPPQREADKLTLEQVKQHLNKQYAIAEGLPAWDLLPPSQLILRTKHA